MMSNKSMKVESGESVFLRGKNLDQTKKAKKIENGSLKSLSCDVTTRVQGREKLVFIEIVGPTEGIFITTAGRT